MALADAPYGTGDGLRAIATLNAIGAMLPESIAVIETGKQEELDPYILALTNLKPIDSRHYGKAAIHFLTS